MNRRGLCGAIVFLGSMWACGDSANPNTPVAVPDASVGGETTQYSGVWVGPDGESGVVDFTFTNPVGLRPQFVVGGAILQGTLRISTMLGPISLTGQVDTTGATVTFSGRGEGALGNFQCPNGRLHDGYFTTECTGQDGRVRYIDSRIVGVDSIERYCAVLRAPTGETSGSLNLFTSGSLAGAVLWSGARGGSAGGIRNGNRITMEIAGRQGSFDLNLDSANDLLTGSYAFTNAPASSGSVLGSKRACPGGGGQPLVDSGTDTGSPIDSGTDTGSPIDSGIDSGSAIDSGSTDATSEQHGDANQPLPDGAADTASDASADAGPDIVSDAGVEASSDAGVGVCASTGTLVYLEATDYVSYVAAAGGYVFYVLNGNQLWRSPLDHSAAPDLFHTSAQSTGFWGLRAEGGNVCWLEGANNPQTPGSVACRPAAGGPSITVVNNLVTPEGLFMRQGSLYWFSRSNRHVYKAPAVSNATFELKYNLAVDVPSDKAVWAAEDSVTHVASDGSKIFFATYNYQLFQSRVYSIAEGAISTGSGNPITGIDVSGAGNQISGLTSDGRYTFWLRSPANPLVGLLAVADNQGVHSGTMNNYVQDGSQLVSFPGEGVAYFSYKFGIAKQAASHSGFETGVTSAAPIPGDNAVRAIAIDEGCVYWFGENAGRGIFAAQR